MQDAESTGTEDTSFIMRVEKRIDSIIPKNINWNIVLIIFSIILIGINFSRLFYNNFWEDECYDILLTRGTYENLMFKTEYYDNHPPLHYLYVKFICDILGQYPFVYNLTSFIPYLLIIVLCLTFVRKHMGTGTATIVMMFASILETSIFYITEMRQYQLAMLFLFIIFLLFYRILEEPSKRNFVILTIVYIMGCYTHYYVSMAGGLMYVTYGIRCLIRKDRTSFRYALISLIVSIVAFLPWLQFMIGSVKRVSDDFWIKDIPSFLGCVQWFFGYNYVYILFLFVLFLTVLYILFKLKVIKNTEGRCGRLLSFFDLSENKWSMAIIGLFSVFLVIGFVSIVSLIMRPVLIVRYIYPYSVIIWLIFALFVTNCRTKKVAFIFVMAVILIPGVPHCYSCLIDEYEDNETIRDTLDVTLPYIEDDDHILSEANMFSYNECLYYYGIRCEFYSNRSDICSHLSDGHQNWVFLFNEMDDYTANTISDMGYGCTLIKENGRIGSDVLWVYLITK